MQQVHYSSPVANDILILLQIPSNKGVTMLTIGLTFASICYINHKSIFNIMSTSGVSTVGPSGARAPLTFSLLNA